MTKEEKINRLREMRLDIDNQLQTLGANEPQPTDFSDVINTIKVSRDNEGKKVFNSRES